MRNLAILSLLCLFSACASGPAPEPGAAPEGGEPAPAEMTALEKKKAELAQVDAQLEGIAGERKELDAQEASVAKSERLAELALLEGDLRIQKAQLEKDIATLMEQEQQAKKEVDPLDIMEEAAKDEEEMTKRAEETEKRLLERQRKREQLKDAEKIAEAERLAKERKAKEEAARKALEEESREGGDPTAKEGEGEGEGEGEPEISPGIPVRVPKMQFEEKYADIILRVKEALQAYKRW